MLPLRSHQLRRALLVVAGLVTLVFATPKSWAQEDIAAEGPPPASVEQSISPIGRSFERPFRLLPPRPLFFPWLKEQLKDMPAFFRDTKLDVNQRTYYFNGGNFSSPRSEALAIGGAFSYESVVRMASSHPQSAVPE